MVKRDEAKFSTLELALYYLSVTPTKGDAGPAPPPPPPTSGATAASQLRRRESFEK